MINNHQLLSIADICEKKKQVIIQWWDTKSAISGL